MNEAAFHFDDHRLCVRIANHDALQHAFWHLLFLLVSGRLLALKPRGRAPEDSLAFGFLLWPGTRRRSGSGFRGALPQHGHDARNVAPHHAKPGRVFQLSAGALETKIELFLFQPSELIAQLIDRFVAKFADLRHRLSPKPEAARRTSSQSAICPPQAAWLLRPIRAARHPPQTECVPA